jgi:hypothetical protein
VRDDMVAFRHDQLILLPQRLGQAANQIEQTLAARLDVCTVLDVAFGPEPPGRLIGPTG